MVSKNGVINKGYKQLEIVIGLIFGLVIVLGGCGQPVANAPTPTATKTPIVEPTATSTATETPLPPTATDTPEPTETPTESPTDTPTAPPPTDTPIPVEPTATSTPAGPMVTVTNDVNVRAGPDTSYDRIGLLPAGTTADVVGQNGDNTWWQIAYPAAPNGTAWIAASLGTASNTDGVPVAAIPPTPTPAAPTATPVPPTPAIDFKIAGIRLWTNEENGGFSPNGSVANCGYGHEINVQVVDVNGQPLDGVVIADIYNNPRQITGSHGPGRTQYVLFVNGYNLFVAEDTGAGRSVTSETSQVLSAKGDEIPIPMLIEGHYCATEQECAERINSNSLCRGHYSWDITFQRTW